MEWHGAQPLYKWPEINRFPWGFSIPTGGVMGPLLVSVVFWAQLCGVYFFNILCSSKIWRVRFLRRFFKWAAWIIPHCEAGAVYDCNFLCICAGVLRGMGSGVMPMSSSGGFRYCENVHPENWGNDPMFWRTYFWKGVKPPPTYEFMCILHLLGSNIPYLMYIWVSPAK